MTPEGEELLHIYLRDHYAGASGGVSLARRIAEAHRGEPDADQTQQLATDVETDRELLLELMSALGVEPSRLMDAAAEAGERFARLKPNGRAFTRSPLSDVIEFETMRLGVLGKLSCWVTLRSLADGDPRISAAALDGLIERAESQSALLEAHRRKALATAFE